LAGKVTVSLVESNSSLPPSRAGADLPPKPAPPPPTGRPHGVKGPRHGVKGLICRCNGRITPERARQRGL